MDPLLILATLKTLSGLKNAFDPESTGGVGGATSAQVQGGQTGLQYEDVLGTEFDPFVFKEYQEQVAEEERERQIADAMALAEQGLWSGGLISLMQGGPLYANQGLEIEDYFSDIEFDPTAISSEVVSYDDITGQPRTEETSLTDPLTGEEFGQQTAEIDEGLKAERRENILEGLEMFNEILDVVKTLKPKEQSTTVSARRSVTPVPGRGGGRAARQERQREGTLGITPFTYQGIADGGVLDRSMFAQNYMPNGGAMQGPGGPKSDLIPVMASDGEYMLSKAAVDQAGGGNHARGIANLEQFNNTGNRRYG